MGFFCYNALILELLICRKLKSYDYNLRGWLTSLSGNKFSETLGYSGYYGGDIASISWNAAGTGTQGYAFAYDALGRMKSAAYSGSGKNYSESLSYDKHGNPASIVRYGRLDNLTGYDQVDNLSSFVYSGNQLKRVTDSKGNQSRSDLMEFKYNYPSGEQYAYDANGNMTKDLNKKISNIQYNWLNLPKRIDFQNGEWVEYLYDASGVKRQARRYIQGTETYSKYTGNIVTTGSNLDIVLTEEGFLKKSGSVYTHYYYLKDHLGNNRVAVNANGTVAQATSYYPFGLSFAENPVRTDQGLQPYKFGGKELERLPESLNLYDFGARAYDPAVGRFIQMDPLAEKYYSISPYAYCLNNPVRFIDPGGKDPGDVFKTPVDAAKDWGKYYNGASILRNKEFGSAIYEVKENGKVVGYAYSVANVGNSKHVVPSLSPNFEKEVADIHSHGAYKEGYLNNDFSPADKSDNKLRNVDGYLFFPDGALRKNDLQKGVDEKPIDKNMPSDKNDPDRKNKIEPTDIPKEKGEKNKERIR